jgi:hypothetical protein
MQCRLLCAPRARRRRTELALLVVLELHGFGHAQVHLGAAVRAEDESTQTAVVLVLQRLQQRGALAAALRANRRRGQPAGRPSPVRCGPFARRAGATWAAGGTRDDPVRYARCARPGWPWAAHAAQPRPAASRGNRSTLRPRLRWQDDTQLASQRRRGHIAVRRNANAAPTARVARVRPVLGQVELASARSAEQLRVARAPFRMTAAADARRLDAHGHIGGSYGA